LPTASIETNKPEVTSQDAVWTNKVPYMKASQLHCYK